MLSLNLRKLVLVFFVAAAVGVTFSTNYGIQLREFGQEAREKRTQINRYIELSRTFIELMTIYGNEYFQQSKNIGTELYGLLQYDRRKDSFSLDAAAGTKYEKAAGNLTGKGRIPEKGINRDELNLALKYNEFFSDFYDRLEGVEWLYYTSENDFINLYPWVPSSEFEYYKGMKSSDFYRLAEPRNNPHRRALWVPVYLDHAGRGIVVTLSSPIYNGGSFMGVISLDISANKLKELISTDYESYLIDARNSVIAAGSGTTPDRVPVNFLTVLRENRMGFGRVASAQEDIIHRAGRYYMYSSSFDRVPWRFYQMVPVSRLAYRAFIVTLPIMLIGVLLAFAMHEFDKLKKTELLLQSSLIELKSYQKLLENAAKLDMLTNTFNRRGFKESFRNRLAEKDTERPPIAFIIGDIDYFKQFNDTFGHAAGDKVLIAVADTIRKNTGSEDLICRWGGEEFVIVLFGKAYEEALAAAEKIRAEVEGMAIPWEQATLLKGTMTLGVAEYNYAESIDECVSKADSALYRGKENGRNQVNGYRDFETA